MPRSRSRSRSRSYSPRGRPSGMRRERDLKTSLLFRNLSKTTTADDLRHYAERFGPLRDIYLPKDFHTHEPRGLGFVEFSDAKDAEEARNALDASTLAGRVITVQFAQHGRKRPDDYRGSGYRSGGGGGYGGGGGGGYGGGGGGYGASRGDRGYDRDRGHRDNDYGRDRDYRDRDRERDRDRDRDYRGRDRDRDRDSRRPYSRSPRRGRSRSPKRSPRRDRSVSRSRSPPTNTAAPDREYRDDRGRERSPDEARLDSGRERARSPEGRSPTPQRE